MALLRAAVRELHPLRAYVIPAYRSPFKDTAPVSFVNRLNMLRLALRAAGLLGAGPVRISGFEGRKKRVSYTFETINHFRRLHPGAKIYFLLGSDCLAGFGGWKNGRAITARARLLVGARRGFALKNPSGAPFSRLAGFFPEVSSTSLRCALLAGERSRFVCAPVREYIRRKGLYFLKQRLRLRALLSRARYSHSLSVAGLAARLALQHGQNPQRAALAGLLHDAARDLKPGELVRYARAKRLRIPCFGEVAKRAPVLIHSYASARLAAERFGVKDAAVLRAIARHTLGGLRMDAMSKIIYVADLAAAGRSFAPAAKIARLAARDLDAAYCETSYIKLKHAAACGLWEHPLSRKLWKIRQKKKG